MPDRCSPTLAAALADWLAVRSAGRGLSPNTRRAYRADVERVAVQLGPTPTAGDDRPAAARARVDQLTPTALVDALAAIQRSGAAPASRSRSTARWSNSHSPGPPGRVAGRSVHRRGPGATEAPPVPLPLHRTRRRHLPDAPPRPPHPIRSEGGRGRLRPATFPSSRSFRPGSIAAWDRLLEQHYRPIFPVFPTAAALLPVRPCAASRVGSPGSAPADRPKLKRLIKCAVSRVGSSCSAAWPSCSPPAGRCRWPRTARSPDRRCPRRSTAVPRSRSRRRW